VYFYAVEASVSQTANRFVFQERKKLKEFVTGTSSNFMDLAFSGPAFFALEVRPVVKECVPLVHLQLYVEILNYEPAVAGCPWTESTAQIYILLSLGVYGTFSN